MKKEKISIQYNIIAFVMCYLLVNYLENIYFNCIINSIVILYFNEKQKCPIAETMGHFYN